MSASHNPGGPKEDWGIKFNYTNGEPAPEKITDKIFGFTEKISELKIADIPDTDLSKLGSSKYGDFEVRTAHMWQGASIICNLCAKADNNLIPHRSLSSLTSFFTLSLLLGEDGCWSFFMHFCPGICSIG